MVMTEFSLLICLLNTSIVLGYGPLASGQESAVMAIRANSFLILLLIPFTVLGCGPLLPGQERILRFTVINLKLALPMTYTEDQTSRAMYPNVSQSASQVQTVVRSLLMGAVNDVLEEQGRRAGLSGAITSVILDQLAVNVTYEPLKCDTVSVLTDVHRVDDKENCLVTSSIVNSICTKMNMGMCVAAPMLKDVPQKHQTITGTLRIGNLIMAGWSQQMWQTILNRVLRSLSTGTFATSFQAASVSIA